MGGKGSGNYYRWNKQEYLEDLLSIDWRKLRKNGWIEESKFHTLHWSVNGQEIASIKYFIANQKMSLHYRIRKQENSEWTNVIQHVEIIHSSCNFGGTRTFLNCPECGNRILLLYLKNSFVCRKCSGLKHKSVNESHMARLERKLRKYHEKLYPDFNLSPLDSISDLPKPKRMKNKQFKKLHSEGMAVQIQYANLLAQRYGDLTWFH